MDRKKTKTKTKNEFHFTVVGTIEAMLNNSPERKRQRAAVPSVRYTQQSNQEPVD